MGRQKDPTQLEKLMSYILGRRPDEFGLVLDDQGFVRMKDLLKAISEESGWGYVRQSHIREALATSKTAPFVVDNEKIKAVDRDDNLSSQENAIPPKLLYHCVRRRAYPVVREKGIIPLGQPRVYLATTEAMAERMGKRRDPAPVSLTVQARRASEAGTGFHRQGEFIYITDHIGLDYFTGPPLRQEKENLKPGQRQAPKPEAPPGGFMLNMERSRSLLQQKPKGKGKKKEIAWKKDARKQGRRKRTG